MHDRAVCVQLIVGIVFAVTWLSGHLFLAYRRYLITKLKTSLKLCMDTAIAALNASTREDEVRACRVLFDAHVPAITELVRTTKIFFNWGTRIEIIHFLIYTSERLNVIFSNPTHLDLPTLCKQFQIEIEEKHDHLERTLNRLRYKLIA